MGIKFIAAVVSAAAIFLCFKVTYDAQENKRKALLIEEQQRADSYAFEAARLERETSERQKALGSANAEVERLRDLLDKEQAARLRLETELSSIKKTLSSVRSAVAGASDLPPLPGQRVK